ncbi:MAG: divalent-cation tolerance protein CutA [Burkholderiaceae bacterium]|jgi:periplasmic divalent cation tolerance protein|nr:divalent-cation tolerance protein CutA [Burkholderiaceae bacterium]
MPGKSAMPDGASIQMVLTTVGSQADAQRLGRQMVENRLASCAQIQGIESIYDWDGAVRHEPEWRLLFKTTPGRSAALVTELRRQHPYRLPAIVALPARATAEFAQWVAQNCASSRQAS